MVVLLVILTFAVLLSVGFIMEYREQKARELKAVRHFAAEPVFAQDGGEPIEEKKETATESDSGEDT